jgi:hypothetical protein
MSLPLFKRTSFLVIWSVFGRFLTEDWSVSVMQAATDRDKPAATPRANSSNIYHLDQKPLAMQAMKVSSNGIVYYPL